MLDQPLHIVSSPKAGTNHGLHDRRVDGGHDAVQRPGGPLDRIVRGDAVSHDGKAVRRPVKV